MVDIAEHARSLDEQATRLELDYRSDNKRKIAVPSVDIYSLLSETSNNPGYTLATDSKKVLELGALLPAKLQEVQERLAALSKSIQLAKKYVLIFCLLLV